MYENDNQSTGIETGITVDISNIRELNTGVCPITLTGK